MSALDLLGRAAVTAPEGPLLIVSTETGYGGAERSIEILLRHLPPGMAAGILAESPLHVAQLHALQRPGLEVAVVSTTDDEGLRHAVRQFIRLHQRLRPRAILVNTRPAARIVAAAARWLPGVTTRSFLYVHDLLWPDLGETLGQLPGTTVLVPDASVLRRRGYLEPHVVPRGPVRALIMPNPVELPAMPPAPPAADAPFLHLATVNRWKGHRHLISAVGKLCARGQGVRVRSFGYRPEAALLPALQDEIGRLGVGRHITLEDYTPDPAPLLRNCLGVVITSVSHSGGPETFGRTIIEAWAHARPVVAFAAGAPAGIIRHLHDGILVPEGDEAALADALHQLRSDEALRERLARNGHARAREEYAAGVVVPRLLGVLSSRTAAPEEGLRPGGSDGVGPRVLLDVTETLTHGWLTPHGMLRVEAEVIAALRATPGIQLDYVRYDRGQARFVTLPESGTAWLANRFGWPEPVSLPRPQPAVRHRWRDDLRARIGMLDTLLPAAGRPAARLVWRMLRHLRDALRPSSVCAPMPPARATSPVDALPPGDVLVCAANPWNYASPSEMQAWRAQGRGLVLVLHDLLPYEVPHLTAGREVRGFVADMIGTLAQADRIIAVSEHTARSYRETMGGRLPSDTSITVMAPSVARHLCEAGGGVAPSGLDPSRPFVVFCSTIEVRKNHLLLLNLWEKLRQDLPEQTLPQLVFAGRWGWGADAVRLWVERNWRLAPHLRVMEGLTDQALAWLYRHALFTVFPSHAEGFGMPVAESLACGVPVVTANHPALLEAAERLMPAIDPLDFPAWEREIRRLIMDPAYLEELKMRARSYRGTCEGDLGRAVAAAAAQGRGAICIPAS